MAKPLLVLMVEDSADDALLIQREIRKAGYDLEFKRVDTQAALVQALREKRWDIVLSDYSMPGFNGEAVLQAVRAFDLDMPFIMISGTMGEAVAVAMMRAGAHDYLMKNSLARLVPALQRELREAEIRRAKRVQEQALRESERKFRLLAEFTRDWEYWHDSQGRFLYVSPACERITGYKPEEFIADPALLDRITLAEDQAANADRIARALAEDAPLEMQFRIRHRDGRAVWIDHACVVIFGPDGKSCGRRATNRDITERKQMDAALQASEYRFRTLFEKAADGIFIMTLRGKLLRVNESFAAMHGYTIDEILKQDIQRLDVLCGEAMKRGEKLVDRLLAGEVLRFDVEHYHRDGHVFPLSVTTNVIHLDGQPYILAFHRDITERKRAEEKLRESEAKYRNLAETSIEGVGLAVGNRVIWANPALVKIFGYASMEEFCAVPILDTVAPESRDLIRQRLEKRAKNEPLPPIFECRILRKDGEIRDVEISASETNIGDQRVVQSTFRDITERKRAEQALRESEERYRSVVDNVAVGISLISPAMKVLAVNRTIQQWFPSLKVSEQPLCYRALHEPPRDGVCSHCPTIQALRDGRVHEALAPTARGGETRYYHLVASPIKNAEGRVTSAIEMLEDITERRNVEENLRKAQIVIERQQKFSALGLLAATLAHEIRNPLTAIKVRLYTLRKQLARLEGGGEDISLIGREIDRLDGIVREFLEFALPREPRLEATSPGALFKEVEDLLSPEMQARGIRLSADAGDDRPLRVDAGQIKQVLINLVRNAADSLPAKGVIRLRASTGVRDRGGKRVPSAILEVEDTGQGIPPEVQERIFDPFFTTKREGTGLGLAIALNFVEKHGGSLDFQTKEGNGTTFRITIPSRMPKTLPDAK